MYVHTYTSAFLPPSSFAMEAQSPEGKDSMACKPSISTGSSRDRAFITREREEEGEKNEDDATTRPHFLDCVSDRSIPPG